MHITAVTMLTTEALHDVTSCGPRGASGRRRGGSAGQMAWLEGMGLVASRASSIRGPARARGWASVASETTKDGSSPFDVSPHTDVSRFHVRLQEVQLTDQEGRMHPASTVRLCSASVGSSFQHTTTLSLYRFDQPEP